MFRCRDCERHTVSGQDSTDTSLIRNENISGFLSGRLPRYDFLWIVVYLNNNHCRLNQDMYVYGFTSLGHK
jgi:hypothetical protein